MWETRRVFHISKGGIAPPFFHFPSRTPPPPPRTYSIATPRRHTQPPRRAPFDTLCAVSMPQYRASLDTLCAVSMSPHPATYISSPARLSQNHQPKTQIPASLSRPNGGCACGWELGLWETRRVFHISKGEIAPPFFHFPSRTPLHTLVSPILLTFSSTHPLSTFYRNSDPLSL